MRTTGSMNPFELIVQRLTIDRQEYIKTFLLFSYLFCVVSASTIGRTAADTLFLSRFGPSQLSFMYLPQATALILVGYGYQRLSARFRTDRLLPVAILTISLLALGSRVLVGLGAKWVFPVIYVSYDVLNFLMITSFWQFTTAILDQRKAKKTIVTIGSGGIIGSIVSGFGLKLLVGALGTENLIFVYAGLQALCLVLVLALLRRIPDPKEAFAEGLSAPKKAGPPGRKGVVPKEFLFQNVAHLKYLAIMSGTLIISLTLIDYQFKVILRSTLQGEALAAFMGNFYGYSGILSLVVQFFIASKIITRFGVMTALVVFPIALFAGSMALWLMPVMLFAVVVKGSDKALGDTIYSSVNQLIMFPIPPEWRSRAKGFLDGVVRNGAKGVAAVAIIVLSRWMTVQQLSWIILALLVVCIVAAIRVKGPYLQTLLATLHTRDFEEQETSLDLIDPASLQVLTEALDSPDKMQVIYALRTLKGLRQFNLFPYVPKLLHHPEAEVAIAALQYLQQALPPGGDLLLPPLLQAPASVLQAHALLALAAYAHEDQLEAITAYLEAPEIELKAAAIAGLVKYYGIEGMFRAVGKLKELMESSREAERVAMASLFGQVGVASFYKPLVPLLQDPSVQVRVQALQSAGVLRVPELIPFIVPLLQAGSTREPALAALAGYDEKVLLKQLEPFLLGPAPALHLPRLYERIGTQRAFDKLLAEYEQFTADMREKVLESLLRLKAQVNRIERPLIEGFINHEISLYWQTTEHGLKSGAGAEFDDLVAAYEQMKAHVLVRIFHLLALLYDAKTIGAVYTNWQGSDIRRQANAMEVIDQLLQGPLRTALNRIMAARHTLPGGPGPSGPANAHLLWLYTHGDDWLRQVMHHAWHHRTGAAATWDLLEKKFAQEGGGTSPDRLSGEMEQVRLLKKVTIFKQMSGKDLAAIALQLEEVVVRKGDTVICENQLGDSLYLIQSGTAGVFRNAIPIGALGPGECFGETAVLTQSLRTATVRAEDDMVLWCLGSHAFYEIAFDRSGIALEIIRYLSTRLRQMNARAASPKAAADEPSAPPLWNGSRGPSAEAAPGTASITNGVILRRVLVLQKISLFRHFSQDDFVRLAKLVEEMVYEPGELIFQSGEEGDTMYGIIEGSVRVHHGADELAALHAGECFGEMALIDGEPRSADCSATQRTTLLELTREQVFFFCFQRMDVLKGMMRVLAERLKGMQEKV